MTTGHARRGRPGRGRWTGAVATAAALVCAAGCAGVPTGGRVVSGRSAQRAEPIDDPYVRIVPVSPGRNWPQPDIVKGFLIASANFDDAHKVAREYLSRGTRWNPDPRPRVIVLKDEVRPAIEHSGDATATVKIEGDQLGEIGPDGQYTAEPKPYSASFGLVKDAQGQWRIKDLPAELQAGLLLGKSDVDRAFRTLNLYFFSPDEPVLVPNGIFLPLIDRQKLATQLAQSLLKGPTGWLEPAVISHFPAGTRLKEGVDVTDGVATVNLSSQARRADVNAMSAQLSWTLRRLPEVRQLKLQIEGKTVEPNEPGKGGPVQAPQIWDGVNPDVADGTGEEKPAYMRGPDGRLARLLDKRPETAGVVGNDRLHRPSVSLDTQSQQVAGLNATADAVLAGDLAGSVPVRAVLRASRRGAVFTAPSWSRRDTMWTVESGGGRSRLLVRRKGVTEVAVRQWGLAGSEVLALRVARDGIRAAAIVRVGKHKQLQVGRVVHHRDGGVAVDAFLPISSELEDVTDLAWADSNTLAVLGKTHGGQVTPYSVPVSGGGITPIGSGASGDPQTIAAAPNSPILVGALVRNKDKICWQKTLRDRFSEWECSRDGADPSYRG